MRARIHRSGVVIVRELYETTTSERCNIEAMDTTPLRCRDCTRPRHRSGATLKQWTRHRSGVVIVRDHDIGAVQHWSNGHDTAPVSWLYETTTSERCEGSISSLSAWLCYILHGACMACHRTNKTLLAPWLCWQRALVRKTNHKSERQCLSLKPTKACLAKNLSQYFLYIHGLVFSVKQRLAVL